jgi:hypothetical protein
MGGKYCCAEVLVCNADCARMSGVSGLVAEFRLNNHHETTFAGAGEMHNGRILRPDIVNDEVAECSTRSEYEK